MASDIPVDASSQHHSIVYCPSCGASASLPIVPPSNAGLFCDICTSTNLLVSTNDGADWNPLSDAFNALSLSHDQQGGDSSNSISDPSAATAPAPHIIQHPAEDLQIESPTPTIQDEMKRRSLILSELMNFREALYQHHGTEETLLPSHNNHDHENASMESEMEVSTAEAAAAADHFSNIARTYNDLLHLRQQSGMFLMDEVDTMGAFNGADESGSGHHGGGGGMYIHPDNNLMYHQQHHHNSGSGDYLEEEEGMYDDPPQDYVNAHPPVQEAEQAWYGTDTAETQVKKEELPPQPPPPQQQQHQQRMEARVLEDGEDDDEDDDEGQVYATPEQREEMKRRRSELHQDKELKAREMFWRKYGIGNLGTGH
ncbi:hypothetical protein TWF730_000172 [Orbilia blumenaviensis]|uniref:Uncharacterized protein n=1 Tax=Orbilia blumenaviensis TaxID=1796055 RepID=A0AAV9VKR0_9PEZI